MPTLRIDATDATPIWSQIEEGVRRLVAAGTLPPGSPIPSVRELASELRINPATVAKAYQRLTESGVLTVRRGEGTYVSDSPPPMSRGERARLLEDAATRTASLALTLGATEEECLAAVRSAWRHLEGEKRGRT
jgi:GntR family transcriptional regulator